MPTSNDTNKRPYRPFTKVPDSIIRAVLSFLSPRGICLSCTTVSKRFCAESTNTSIVIIEQWCREYAWVHTLFSTITYHIVTTEHLFENRTTNMLRALHAITSPQILLLGGNSEPHRVDTYDVICNRWTELAQTEIGREVFFEVLWLEGFVYVFCGIHHASYGMVERYNPLSNVWTEVTPLPGKLAAVVGAIMDGKLYICGGYDWHLATYSDAVYTMDVDETGLVAWELLKCRLRMGRSSHACVAFQGKLWVAGGISDEGDSEGNPTIEILDPLLGYWVPGPSLNMRRFRLRLFVVCDELYAVGGDRDDRGRLIIQSIEKLDPSGKSWSHVTYFKVERRGFLSSVVGSKIYIIGGRTGEVPLATWDCYDVITDRWLSEVLPMQQQPGLSPKRAKVIDSSSSRGQSVSPVPFGPGHRFIYSDISSSSSSSSSSTSMMCMSPPPAVQHDATWLASPAALYPSMIVDTDCDEHSNMSICNSSSSSSSSGGGTRSGHYNGLVPHTTLGVRHSKPLGIDEQEMELFGGANENKCSSSSSSRDILDGMEIEKEVAAESAHIILDHCREWLLPSWADSAKSLSITSSMLSCSNAMFPMVTLNRRGGVVGGRAVTIPEATLKW